MTENENISLECDETPNNEYTNMSTPQNYTPKHDSQSPAFNFPIYVPVYNLNDLLKVSDFNGEIVPHNSVVKDQQTVKNEEICSVAEQHKVENIPKENSSETTIATETTKQISEQHNKKEKPPKQRKSGRERTLILVALTILISFVFGFAGSIIYNIYFKPPYINKAEVVINQSNDHENLLGLNEEQVSLPAVIDATEDSVVAITTSAKSNGTVMGQYVKKGAGSGVIISEDGYIITNTHVIETASSITVKLSNGQQFNAAIIGTDMTTDISIIKINAKGLKPVTFGNSEKLVVGQTIIAIGNPLGELGGTVTTGIISSLDRELSINGQSMNLLQISAAVNPGNSGGGLFNLNGELIGIVNAKSSGAEVEGLGFAIPIDDIKDVIKQLIEYGKVNDRAQLGVTVIEVEDMAMIHDFADSEIYNYIDAVGVYVTASIDPNLILGDRILAIDGETISQFSDIKKHIDKKKVGDVVEVTISRNKKVQTVTVTLTEKN